MALESHSSELADDDLKRFLALIYRVAGIRIPPTKKVMVANRIRRRLKAKGIHDFSSYYAFLTSPAGASEMPQFLNEITTNETYFHRDPQHFAWLSESFFPEVIKSRAAGSRPASLRIWSAACSSGEEVYSIALKLREFLPRMPGWRITLLGTDISAAALAAARAGAYDQRAIRLVDPARRDSDFTHNEATGLWTLKPEIRSLATWKLHNLLEPLAEDPFDCIFIKNVLIYFDDSSKRVVVDRLLNQLAPGGYLVVGPTEGIYKMLDSLERLRTWLYRKPPAPGRGGAALRLGDARRGDRLD